MKRRWRQIDPGERWRALDVALATVRVEPPALEFVDRHDGPDLGATALLEADDGRQFALVRRRGSIDRETTILTSRFSPSLAADLDEILSLLDLTRDDVTWTHPELDGTRWALWREDDNGNRVAMRAFALREAADFARAEYEAKGHKQTYWVEPSREPIPRTTARIDPDVEFPLWEIWRGDPTDGRRRLDCVRSRVEAERLLADYRAREPVATFWTAPKPAGEDTSS